MKLCLLLLLATFSLLAAGKTVVVRSTANSGPGTLRDAIAFEAANGDTILIDVKGTITLNSTITIANFNDLVIFGPSPAHNTIQASNTMSGSLFSLVGNSNLTIMGLGFYGGSFGNTATNYISIVGNPGLITIERCLFKDITYTSVGGPIYAESSNTNIKACSFVNNQSSHGGAIYIASGTMHVENSTFWSNQAGINGGAISVQTLVALTLVNNTFYENDASGSGEAIHANGPGTNVVLTNNAFVENSIGQQMAGSGTFGSVGGNVIKENFPGETIPFILAGSDNSGFGLIDGLRSTEVVDGFGLIYFTITNPASVLIDQGVSAGLPPVDGRNAPRMLDGNLDTATEPDVGACEYTFLRVTNSGGNALIPNTLPWALAALQNNDFINYIEFDIPGAVTPISPAVPMQLGGNYIIDGFSQPGSSVPGPGPMGMPGVFPAVLPIHIDNAAGNGLDVNALSTQSKIYGLRVTNFTGHGILLQGANTVVAGCEIGIDEFNTASGNGLSGIYVFADNCVVGGYHHARRNVVAGNGWFGFPQADIAVDPTGFMTRIESNVVGIARDGTGAASNLGAQHGIYDRGSSTLIGAPFSGNVISGNTTGIWGSACNGIRVYSNIIGMDYNGMMPVGNNNGILLDAFGSNAIVGAADSLYRNIISGNGDLQLRVHDFNGVSIVNNFIGPDRSGLASPYTSSYGIYVSTPNATNITIGGLTAAEGNVISGNTTGIHIIQSGSGVVITNNLIGLTKNGDAALGNEFGGINLGTSANIAVQIGLPGSGNVISGNTSNSGAGINISGGGAHAIVGNIIGLDKTGNFAISNTFGVQLNTASLVTIGGNISGGDANVISGNSFWGIVMQLGATNNVVRGNLVGTNMAGTAAVGNGIGGVLIADGTTNVIGGSLADRNIISGHSNGDSYGVLLNSSGSGNIVSGNYIGSTISGMAPLGNFHGVAVMGNHTATIGGPSGSENYIVSNVESGIYFTSTGGPLAAGNIIGRGPLGTFAGSGNYYGILVSGPTAGIGTGFTPNLIVQSTTHGIFIDSDFADNVVVQNNHIGTDFIGTNGIGNLANGIAVVDADFAQIFENVIIGNGEAGILLTGSSTDNLVYSNVIADILNNTLTNEHGIFIAGSTFNTIGGQQGVNGNMIGNSLQYGIYVQSADNNNILGNTIGTDGVDAYPNTTGVRVENSTQTLIGDENAIGVGTFNVISGNTLYGIEVISSNITTIRGNTIGLNLAGILSLPNSHGIYIGSGSTATEVGSNGLIMHRNTISGNQDHGITIESNSNTVKFNYIGTSVDGSTAIGTQNYGIVIGAGGTANMIGGDRTIHGNLIAGNEGGGVYVGETGNFVYGNTFGVSSSGAAIGAQQIGVHISGGIAGNNFIGTQPGGGNDFGNVILNQQEAGIKIESGAAGNEISGNFIGIDPGNLVAGSQVAGVVITNSAGSGNKIGLDVLGGGNVISGNIDFGIKLDGASNQEIYNNRIGTNVGGTAIVANSTGVGAMNGGSNIIGGPGLKGNLVSGNAFGIHLQGPGSTGNVVSGNIVGMDLGLGSSVPNTAGIRVADGATNNFIGVAGTGAGNIVSGNTSAGILVSTSNGNFIRNNRIGLFDGNRHGIVLQASADDNIIGGNPSERNIISGNDSMGVAMSGSGGNQVIGNFIGTAANGNLPNPNLIGVFVIGGGFNWIGTSTQGNLISSNTIAGVFFESTSNNQVQNNFFGTDSTGNDTFLNSGNGVGVIDQNSFDDLIGGTLALNEDNIICNSTTNGVYAENCTGTKVWSNSIGISEDGSTYLGNGTEGVKVVSGNSNVIGDIGLGNAIAGNTKGVWMINGTSCIVGGNFIGNNQTGTTTVLAGSNDQLIGVHIDSATQFTEIRNNVISGNDEWGVKISGANTGNNLMSANLVGTDVSGNIALPNASGVLISDGANNNVIGSGSPPVLNVISGNSVSQVSFIGPGTTVNWMFNAYIGFGADGVTPLGGVGGVTVEDQASDTWIGDAIAGYGCYIGNMAYSGIGCNGNSTGTLIRGNKIGVDILGNLAPIGQHGIEFNEVYNATIGGVLPGEGNEIANIGGNGIGFGDFVDCDNIQILGNSIHDNVGQGIDIGNDGAVLTNDGIENSGNNSEIDFPEIISAFDCVTSGSTRVGFVTKVTPGLSYTVEFFSNTSPDATNGEGETFLGRTTVTPTNNPDTLSYDFGTTLPGATSITATITGAVGTSEFGTNFMITGSPFSPAYTTNPESCLGANDGSISVTATNAWHFFIDADPLAMGNQAYNFTNVTAGVHNLSVEYPNGCVINTVQTVDAGTPLTFNYEFADDTCSQGLGAIGFTAEFGSPGPFLYSFNGGASFDTSIDTLNITAGTYVLVLQDDILGCLSFAETIVVSDVTDVIDESFVYPGFCPGTTPMPVSVATAGGNFTFGTAPGDGALIDGSTGIMSGGVTGTIYEVVYTVGACFESDTIFVEGFNTDNPGFTIADFCEGSTSPPTVIETGGTFSFEPDPGDGTVIDPVSGLFNGLGGVTYMVKYVTGGPCPDSLVIPVVVLDQPAAPVITAIDSIYCSGDPIAAADVVVGGGQFASWYLGSTATAPVSTSPGYTPASLQTGNNYIFVTITSGSCTSLADSINYYLSDTNGMTAVDDFETCLASIAQLDAMGGVTYAWSPAAEVSDATIHNPEIEVMAPTTLTVIITNADGCSVTDSVLVGLLPLADCHVDTYNAFSPNADGVNDFWIIDGIEGYSQNTVTIFSRWGDVLISFDNYNNDDVIWDGTNSQGKPAPADTFFYVVDVGGEQSQSGWVQVVR